MVSRIHQIHEEISDLIILLFSDAFTVFIKRLLTSNNLVVMRPSRLINFLTISRSIIENKSSALIRKPGSSKSEALTC